MSTDKFQIFQIVKKTYDLWSWWDIDILDREKGKGNGPS